MDFKMEPSRPSILLAKKLNLLKTDSLRPCNYSSLGSIKNIKLILTTQNNLDFALSSIPIEMHKEVSSTETLTAFFNKTTPIIMSYTLTTLLQT